MAGGWSGVGVHGCVQIKKKQNATLLVNFILPSPPKIKCWQKLTVIYHIYELLSTYHLLPHSQPDP